MVNGRKRNPRARLARDTTFAPTRGHFTRDGAREDTVRERGRTARTARDAAARTGDPKREHASFPFERRRNQIPGEDVLRLDPVLEAVELPARVTGLDTGLADVDGDDFTHGE